MSRKRCNDGKGQSPSGDGEGERKTARSFRGSVRAVLGMEAVTTRPFVGLEPSDILAPPLAVLAASLRQVAKLAPAAPSARRLEMCSGSVGEKPTEKPEAFASGLLLCLQDKITTHLLAPFPLPSPILQRLGIFHCLEPN